MSLDYGTGRSALLGTITAAGGAANTVLGYVWSKTYNFLALQIAARVSTAGAAAGSTLTLELSDSAGAFGAPITLATITFANPQAAASQLESRVPDNLALVEANGTRCVRLMANSTGANALVYSYRVTTTSLHE
jgi:hypothetical protein